jgi:hypothetical protein
MSRIKFSGSVTSMHGSIAGTTFQDSYGGAQMRTRVKPDNPRTFYQQFVRGNFAFITGSWRNLTFSQMDSFNLSAPMGYDGFSWFVALNVNLSLIGKPLLTDFVASSVPPLMPMSIFELTSSVFSIYAASAVIDVPADTELTLFATPPLPASLGYINPSLYTFFASFAAGNHFLDPIDLAPWYYQKQLPSVPGRVVMLKSFLTSTVNGTRGGSSFVSKVAT